MRRLQNRESKKNRTCFESFRETFLSIFYWTHYQKCFPGKREGEHKQPKKECANKYLKREIEAFEPEIIICMGGKAVEYVTGEKLLHAISKNGENYVIYSGRKILLIALTHPSDANNGAKNSSSYRYEETIKLIHEKVSRSQKRIYEK
nr:MULTISPECIES: uracil-DNA glycosylase family protein [unclassified Methanosarcina]